MKRRTDGAVASTIPATELWDKISYAAWACADPGVQFDTTINEWHTCPEDGRINASNPCSEYMFLDDTACNLASINLVKFLDEEGNFDIDRLPPRDPSLDYRAGSLRPDGVLPVASQSPRRATSSVPSASATPTSAPS